VHRIVAPWYNCFMANFPHIRLRQNGRSLYMRVPPEFIRANNLKAGDIIMPDLNTFKIVRQDELETLCREPEVVPAQKENWPRNSIVGTRAAAKKWFR
jgi:hypothetical protein